MPTVHMFIYFMLSIDIHVFHPLKSEAHMHNLESIFWQGVSTMLQYLRYFKMYDGHRAHLNTQLNVLIFF